MARKSHMHEPDQLWIELMECVEAAVEAGESRAEVMRWAREEHYEHHYRAEGAACAELGWLA